jgi:hypothetical protein
MEEKKNMARRCRSFTSLDECLNPVYFEQWGSVPSVKECIHLGFAQIQQKAYRRISQHGSATIVLPPLTATPVVVRYISSLFMQLCNEEQYIQVCFDSEKSNKKDILVQWVSISLVRPKFAIPVGWDDNEKEYTWQDVLDNSHEYPSSSTDFGPPLEFQIKAQEEKIKNIQKNLDHL